MLNPDGTIAYEAFQYERLRMVAQTANKAVIRGDALARAFGELDSIAPISGLNMAFNHMLFTLEAFSFYYSRWGIEEGTRLSTGQDEREGALLTNAIISALSAFEHTAKAASKTAESPISFDVGQRVYLGSIMGKSFEADLIDQQAHQFWNFVREFRNCLVHNNGIAERWMIHTLPSGATLEMRQNIMMVGTSRNLIELIGESIDRYADWAGAFLARKAAAG